MRTADAHCGAQWLQNLASREFFGDQQNGSRASAGAWTLVEQLMGMVGVQEALQRLAALVDSTGGVWTVRCGRVLCRFGGGLVRFGGGLVCRASHSIRLCVGDVWRVKPLVRQGVVPSCDVCAEPSTP